MQEEFQTQQRNIGSRIESKRKALGLSQAALAVAAGVTSRSIGAWERGESSPQGDNLRAVAKALQTKPEWILTGEGEMVAPPAQEAGPSKFRLETTTLRRLEAPIHQLAADEILSETDYLLNSLAGLSETEVPTFMRAWRQAKEEARRARDLAKQTEAKDRP